MGHPYSTGELRALRFLVEKYGDLTYILPRNIEIEYYALTGVMRAHGCLYMAAWRLKNGYYDARLSA
jgi:hypothetical protein